MKRKVIDTGANQLSDQELQALTRDPAVAQFIQAVAARAVPPATASNVETFMAEVREAFSDEEWEKAVAWVERVFEKLINRPENGEPEIVFARITSTAKTRKQGLTKAPNGFGVIRTLGTEKMAAFYIESILKQGLTDEAKIWDMIKYSRSGAAGELHPEWNFLIATDGKGNEELELWTHVHK